MDTSPVLVDIVLVGGGHSHVYVLKMFGMDPLPGVRLTLVTKQALTPYSGMMPGHVAGYYTRKECHVDLVRLAKFANARFVLAEADGIDQENKTISLKGDRPPIKYDIMSIDIGSTPKSLQDNGRRAPRLPRPVKPAAVGAHTNDEDVDGFVLTPSVDDDGLGGAVPAGLAEKVLAHQDKLMEQQHKALLERITPVKPIDGFSARWDAIIAAVSAAPTGKVFRLVIVGGGAGGVELALSMHHRLTQLLERRRADAGDAAEVTLDVTLLTRGPAILRSHNGRVQKCIMKLMRNRGIHIKVQCEAVGVRPWESGEVGEEGRDTTAVSSGAGSLLCADGSAQPFDECVWCTQAKGAAWLRGTGLALDEGGFIKVQDTLESVNSKHIFACGDIAAVVNQPRPKSGVYAVRQGKPLFDNLRRAAVQQPLVPFVQQKSGLAIIGCGDGYAVASKGSWFKMEGKWVWNVKDWIDRKWMGMYSDLPDIEEMMAEKARVGHDNTPALTTLARTRGEAALEVLSHAAMRCGGCGSKVGASVLSRVMTRLRALDLLAVPPSVAADVIVGLDDPDDAAVVNPPPDGHVTIHTVDFFRSFLDDPYIFGCISANHALSDCHAMCADPHTALAIVTAPYGLPDEVEETIFQMMAGACSVLKAAGCALVGGHTAEGAELCLGFAVNGVARKGQVLHKGGMRTGDKIIITKAVGTGTLFAAHMRGLSDGDAVTNALVEMQKSNQHAARILRDVGGATCCTDITGFGVVGHLVEMLQASDDNDKFNQHFMIEHKYFGADLNLDALPVLPGAPEALAVGVTSSLQSSNLIARRGLVGATDTSPERQAVREHVFYPLLFDPQTAGGLLATVGASKANAVVTALRAIGFQDACVLGSITEANGPVERINVTSNGDDAGTAAVARAASETAKRVALRKANAKKKAGGVAARVSAIIWPENAGAKGTAGQTGTGGRRQLFVGVLLGLVVAYLWGAVGRPMTQSDVDMICVPSGHS